MRGINHNCNLCIVEDIGRGISLNAIRKKLDCSKRMMSYYLSTLKRCGFVVKRGYGVWEKVKDYDEKKVQLSEVGRSPSFIKPHKEGAIKNPVIRTHGLCFKLWIPRLKRWADRQGFLSSRGFDTAVVNKSGVRAMYKGYIVHLFPNSILVYGVSDFYGRSAGVGVGKCVKEFFRIIHGLERLMGTSFRRGKVHKFKVFRGHSGNVSNELAKAYLDSGHGKYVGFDRGSAWLQIDGSLSKDGSFELKELETIEPESFERDMDQVIMPFMNFLRNEKDFDFKQFVKSTYLMAQNQIAQMENIKKHYEVLDQIGKQVGRVAEELKLRDKPKKFGQLKIQDF